MIPHKIYHWSCGDRTVELGKRTLIMGILNVTPDSFSDGGNYSDVTAAVDRALAMVAEGADIIDIGGESTRPGAKAVSLADEIKRTVPVIKQIRAQSDIPISIDTTKAEVARQALAAGADIVNDVSALEADPMMAGVVARNRAGAVLMHMRGNPRTMQTAPTYDQVACEIQSYLQRQINVAEQAGIGRDQIVIDPGIGFGKTVEHNLELMRHLPDLAGCGCPLLIGVSRKSFIGHVLLRENADERLAGSLGAAAWAVLHGVHILRVHDVIETCDVCRMLDRLLVGDN